MRVKHHAAPVLFPYRDPLFELNRAVVAEAHPIPDEPADGIVYDVMIEPLPVAGRTD